MRQRSAMTLQISLLISASLLEVAANFAANATGSGAARLLDRIALPVVLVLLLVVVVGNIVVFRIEHPAADRPAWDPRQVPYPGLSAFREQDAAVFFGREAQVADLVRRLHAPAQDPADRFVCVTGASGSGKSSLVHAGVLPRLRASRWTILPSVVPGGQPFDRLVAAFATATGADRAVIAQQVAESAQSTRRLTGSVGAMRLGRRLLVIDQAEELVTFCTPEQRERFLDWVAAALAADRQLWVIATLRVEFLPAFLCSQRAELFAAPVALGEMRPADLVAVVERPAALAGIVFEPGLNTEIVQDTETADALPLLAYLLQELYLTAGGARLATRDSYLALGGVAGALARQADEVFGILVERNGADAVLSTLLLLVGMQDGEPVKRRVPLEGLSAPQQSILAAFTDARLLVADTIDGTSVVQAAHEALFRQWPPLRQQVAVRAEQINSRSELERWAGDWIAAGRSPDYLLTGERLALAGRWLDDPQTALQATDEINALVSASRSRDTAFLRRVSESIGAYVAANFEQQPELGILLTTAALDECPPTRIALYGLMASLAHSHGTATLTGHTSTVRAVAWSPDGRHLATASRDHTARLWDAATTTVTQVLTGHRGMLEAICWSPDSQYIATASLDHTVRIWRAISGGLVTTVDSFTHAVHALAWSPDGALLATSCGDRAIRLFDTATWQESITLTGHRDEIQDLAWSRDGTQLASASKDKTFVIWDLTTARPSRVLDGSNDTAATLSWSPDGALLVTGDERARVWDAADGQLLRVLPGWPELILALRCSPSGDLAAIASRSPTIRIQTLGYGDQVAALHGHTDRVWTLAWSPNSTRLLSGSEDSTARIWNTAARGAELRQLTGHHVQVWCKCATPDGAHLASGANDGTVKIWHTETGEHIRTLTGHTGRIHGLSWSPDGTRLATCAYDNSVMLWTPFTDDASHTLYTSDTIIEAVSWSPDGTRIAFSGRDNLVTALDLATGTATAHYGRHNQWICALAWSPTGRLIATGSDDRTTQIWDTATEQLLHELAAHHNWVDGVAWSPDETLLATCSGDWTIRVWDVTTGALIHTMNGHEGRVRAIAWSPDGTRLATGSDDRTVRTWDPHAGRELEIIGVHRNHVSSVTWLPDNRRIVTSSEDHSVRIWSADIDINALLTTARDRVFRTLTPDERQAHLLPEKT